MDFSAAAPNVRPVQPSPDWLPESPPPPTPSVAPHHDQPQPGTARRFVQAFAVFLCLFLVVRTVGLEPFGVPTGSMAPTLIGNHRSGDCPRCGFPVRVGEPGPETHSPLDFANCRCPHCDAVIDLSRAPAVPGDRLMVDKTAYLSRPPRRWEVAVFHCPADTTKPYVKRVVGLPGELIQIAGGDVYADGQLVRKSLANIREVCVPVFDLALAPFPQGWNSRWLLEPPADPKLPPVTRDHRPLTVDRRVLREDSLYLDGTAGPVGLTYRHWNLDLRAEVPVADWLAYNGGPSQKRGEFARRLANGETHPAHDFVVAFDLEVLAGSGTFSCQLTDGTDTVRAELPVGPHGEVRIDHGGGVPPVVGSGVRLEPGRTCRVEFAFVDRRASLAIDGTEATEPLDLPFDPPTHPRLRKVTRPVRLAAQGVAVVLRNFRILRDIHYLGVGRGAPAWRLEPDEYFLLGDNTTNSHDSRLWTIRGKPAPGVPEQNFIGKPFLIHQPMRLARVPVNGRDRSVQTLDWSRFRWLR